MLARTRSASLRSLPHDGCADDADLAASSSTGQPAHGLTPGSRQRRQQHAGQDGDTTRRDDERADHQAAGCTPTWIDLGIPDLDRAMTFYGALFGWEFDVGPAEFGHYTQCLLRGRPVAAIRQNPDPDLPTREEIMRNEPGKKTKRKNN